MHAVIEDEISEKYVALSLKWKGDDLGRASAYRRSLILAIHHSSAFYAVFKDEWLCCVIDE